MLGVLLAVSLLVSSGECQSELCRRVSEGYLSDTRWPDFTDYRLHVQDFYESAGYGLAWTRDGAPTRQAAAIIEVLRQADSKGLDPEDYEGPRWAARLEHLHNARPLDADHARRHAVIVQPRALTWRSLSRPCATHPICTSAD